MVDFAFISGRFSPTFNVAYDPSYVGSPLPGVAADNVLGWYLFASSSQDPTTTPGNYVSVSHLWYSSKHRSVIEGSISGPSTPRDYGSYKMTPNTLTVEPGYTYKAGSTWIRVNGRSPLFSYWNNYNNGIGAFPQVNQKLYIDGVTTGFDNTIINVVGGWEDGVWIADISLSGSLPQDINANTNRYVYVVPNGLIDNLSVTPAAGSTLPSLTVSTNPIDTNVNSIVVSQKQGQQEPTSIPPIPSWTGTVTTRNFYNLIQWCNVNFPGFNFTYNYVPKADDTVSASSITSFLSSLHNCNNAWSGSSMVPNPQEFANGGTTVMDVVFNYPQKLFSEGLVKEFFVSGNNTSANQITVPAGCRYMNIEWCVAGGGGGGYGTGFFDNAADWPARAGGAGAFVHNLWVEVEEGDMIVGVVGAAGNAGQGGDGGIGGDSLVTLIRPSTGNTSTILCHVTGGLGGVSNYNRGGNTWTQGGSVICTYGATGYAGANSTSGPMYTDPQPGTTGGTSPIGTPGTGSSSASGYGAGGGGAGFFDDPKP